MITQSRLIESPPQLPASLRNRTCVYCGRPLSPDNRTRIAADFWRHEPVRCSGLDNAISTAVLAGAGRAAEEKSGDRPSAKPRPLGAISSKQAGQSIAKASALGYAPPRHDRLCGCGSEPCAFI